MTKYINPYTDFGFKKLFGEKANKDLLVDFLNQLLPEKHTIKKLFFKNVENQGDISVDRKAIFDVHCESLSGERFIVEMQKAKVKYFKDRALFYTTFPIKEQAVKGDWNFKLDPIYYIAILDFFYDKNEEKAKVKRDIQLKDQDCEVFFEKLNYVFLQMPAFNKKADELSSHYDKWLYFLKHLEDFNEIPAILEEPVFKKAFNVAEIANLDKKEREAYELSLIAYRDLLNVMDTKFEEGKEVGIQLGIGKGMQLGVDKRDIEVILKAYEMGQSVETIAQMMGKSVEEINEIIVNNT